MYLIFKNPIGIWNRGAWCIFDENLNFNKLSFYPKILHTFSLVQILFYVISAIL